MRNLAPAFVSVCVLFSTSVLAAPPAKEFELGDAAKGEATYKTFCVSCHGEKGEGDGVAGAALNPKPANFTDKKRAALATNEYTYNIIKNGGAANGKSPYMVAWGSALGDDAKVKDVAAYVRAFSKPAAKTPAKAPAKKRSK